MGSDRPIRFLFLYSETGEGHRRVALAAAEGLRDRFGEGAQVELVDALTACAPWPFCRLPAWYGRMLWAGGRPYGAGFRLLDGRRRSRAASRFLWPLVRPAAGRLLAEHPADVVVAFHPLLVHTICQVLACSVPLVAVGTDLVVMHAFWADPAVRRYLVATEAARVQLLRHGVDQARVDVTGLPVGRRFVEVAGQGRRAVRERLGLDPERPLVLVMGGGAGFGPLARVAGALADARLPAQVTILTGRNERLRVRLAKTLGHTQVRVEGFVDGAHAWMRAADLLVTKAGPSTLAESMTLGLPMLLWGAIPAQETPNVRLVVDGGAGVWVPRPAQATAAVRWLLADVNARGQMQRQARRLACPAAADRVAEALWKAALSAGRRDGRSMPTRPSALGPGRRRPR